MFCLYLVYMLLFVIVETMHLQKRLTPHFPVVGISQRRIFV